MAPGTAQAADAALADITAANDVSFALDALPKPLSLLPKLLFARVYLLKGDCPRQSGLPAPCCARLTTPNI